jgi:hypothetical protein
MMTERIAEMRKQLLRALLVCTSPTICVSMLAIISAELVAVVEWIFGIMVRIGSYLPKNGERRW